MIARRTALGMAGAAGLSGAAWLLAGDPAPAGSMGAPAMVPDLALLLPRAVRLELVHRGGTLLAARTPDGWVLPQHASFPVQTAVLHRLLAALAGLRLQEPRTDDPALYTRLGLDDPAGPGASGTLLRLTDGAGAVIAAVIYGHGADGIAPETYVRRPGEAQTWLCAGGLDASPDWLDWIDRAVVDVLPESVRQITSQRDRGPMLVLAAVDGKLSLVAPPTQASIDPDRLADMARSLSHLELLDVTPAAAMPGQPVGVASVTVASGLVLRLAANRDGERLWLHLSTTGEDARLSRWAFAVPPQIESTLFPALTDLAVFQVAATPTLPRSHRR